MYYERDSERGRALLAVSSAVNFFNQLPTPLFESVLSRRHTMLQAGSLPPSLLHHSYLPKSAEIIFLGEAYSHFNTEIGILIWYEWFSRAVYA